MENTNRLEQVEAQKILDEMFELSKKIDHSHVFFSIDNDNDATPEKVRFYARMYDFLGLEPFQKIINNPTFIGD